MSIKVQYLTKVYGTQKVLDEVSFLVPKGLITGFLGPNGAGKSTVMKIITGFVKPTSGIIFINDVEAKYNLLKIKKNIGYLPEHNPLYTDMYVREYLGFLARVHKLKNIKKAIDKAINLCGLEREKMKKIETLSKGYRQRIGLAQSLIHDPDILILDEPNSGLDPNQLIMMRNVIKEASRTKTVILSTHLMQEAEALCDKTVIINKGKIIADDKLENLASMLSQIDYIIEFEKEIDVKLFEKNNISIHKLHDFMYQTKGSTDLRKKIMNIVNEQSLPLIGIQKKNKSLEKVFQELTDR